MGHIPAGEAARRAEVNIQTLRYYERRGLLERPARSAANYRLYTEDAVSRVRFIKRAQRLGFELEEIRELLTLRATRSTSSRVRARAEGRVRQIDESVRSLLAMREALVDLIAKCAGGTNDASCPILKALEAGSSPDQSGGV
jgi:MerR family mercuric resistance operon transcriptional regulator